MPHGLSDDEAAIANMLAGVRAPAQDLAEKLRTADIVFQWGKWILVCMVAAIGAVAHLEIGFSQINKNTNLIEGNAKDVELLQRDKISWDRMQQEWMLFCNGPDSDMSHLRMMWWMKQQGITNHDVMERNISVPPQVPPPQDSSPVAKVAPTPRPPRR